MSKPFLMDFITFHSLSAHKVVKSIVLICGRTRRKVINIIFIAVTISRFCVVAYRRTSISDIMYLS